MYLICNHLSNQNFNVFIIICFMNCVLLYNYMFFMRFFFNKLCIQMYVMANLNLYVHFIVTRYQYMNSYCMF